MPVQRCRISVYIAGKVSDDSVFKTPYWRDSVCRKLEQLTDFTVTNLDPTKESPTYPLDENDADLVFGRDCFLIRSADIVIVYLSDDISVGGSQEMLIAKYFRKPLIGIAPKGGKFFRDKEIRGRVYKNWTHPFVKITCDEVVNDLEEAASCLTRLFHDRARAKDVLLIDRAVDRYAAAHFFEDEPAHVPDAYTSEFLAYKGLIVDAARQRMLAIRYADRPDVSEKVRGRLGMSGGKIYHLDRPGGDFTRRVREETGVEAEARVPFGTWSWTYERGSWRHRIFAIAHAAVYRGGDIRPPVRRNEIDLERSEWISFEHVPIDEFIADEQPLVHSFLHYIQHNPFALV